MDRYFDAVDLYDKDIKIAIQWEGASSAAGRGQQGISSEYIRDITTFKADNKMIFGWALNSHITKNPGTVKFAVRFYKLQPDDNGIPEITFSMSTLTQNITINPALDYTIKNGEFDSKVVYDDSIMIKKRLTDSVTPEGLDPAAEPYFLVDFPLFNESDDAWGIFELTNDDGEVINTYSLVDFKVNRENGKPDGYLFSVQAGSDDAGVISYQWFRRPLGAAPESEEEKLNGVEVYHLTTDTTFSDEHPYYSEYYIEGSTIPAYKVYPVTSEQLGQPIESNGEPIRLFEKFNEYDAVKTGYYRVEAVNRAGIAKKAKQSNLVKIPGPEPLQLTHADITDDGYISVYLDDDGNVDLTMTGYTEQPGDIVTYEWNNVETALAEPLRTISVEQNTADTFAIENISEADRATYDETFFVSVDALRNTDRTEVKTVHYRVTDLAHEPLVDVVNSNIMKRNGETAELALNISTDGMVSDELTYQWYKLKFDEEDPDNMDLDNDLLIPGATNATYHAIDPQVYYCMVTNHANNSFATTKSGNILVSDII